MRVMLALSLFLFVLTPKAVLANESGIGRSAGDLFSFWAASHAFVHGANPYDITQIREALGEEAKSLPVEGLSPVYSPPWVFSLIGVFALLPFEIFAPLWLLITMMLFAGTYFFLRSTPALQFDRRLAKPATIAPEPIVPPLWREVLIVVLFVPFLMTLVLGQLAAVFCLCLAIFVWGVARAGSLSASFSGGLALSVTLIKPHLLLLLYLLLLLDSWQARRFQTLAGLSFGLLLLAGLPLLWQPELYQMFFTKEPAPTVWFTPTLAAWLYYASGENWQGLLFLPAALGMLCFYYFFKATTGVIHPSLLLAVAFVGSALVAPYQWTYDFSLQCVPLLFCYRALLQQSQVPRLAFYLSLCPSCALLLQAFLGSVLIGEDSMQYAVIFPLLLAAFLWFALLRSRADGAKDL